MRERRVPCRNATFAEARSGRHLTWNDSAVCDRCARTSAGARDGGDGSAPVTAMFAAVPDAVAPAGGASHDALHAATSRGFVS